MATDDRPLLVFFTSHRSGPARRMESLLAHIARKERATLRVRRVDVDERPDVAKRFSIAEVPSLALVKGKKSWDKRQSIAERDAKREMARAIRRDVR